MKRSLLTRLAAVMVLLAYAVSSVGIYVHNCDCTGHICSHIALCPDHIHDCDGHAHHGHDCEDHDCDGHDCGCLMECGHHCDHSDCCHSKVYRVSISSFSDDDCSMHIDAPYRLIVAVFSHEPLVFQECHIFSHSLHTGPPLASPSGNKVTILRV